MDLVAIWKNIVVDPAMMWLNLLIPTRYVTIMMMLTRADSAPGRCHTINAVNQPAKMARASAVPRFAPWANPICVRQSDFSKA